MNSKNGAINRIRAFVFEHFPLARERSTGDDDPLRTSGIIDPLGVFEVVEYLENEFNISLQDADIESGAFDTLSGMSELVRTQKKNHAPVR